MKQKEQLNLLKLKTSWNTNGTINHQQIFKANLHHHHVSASDANKIDKVTDQRFPIKHLYVDFMDSMVLRDHPKFKDIKRIFNQYNMDVTNGKSDKGKHFKTVIMDSMIQFMRMMMLAHDSKTKIAILDLSYDWFIKKLTAQKRPTKIELQQEINNIIKNEGLLPQQLIDKQLPSYKLKLQLKDYKSRARTEYKEIDPPPLELANYHTHNIGLHEKQTKNNKQQNYSKNLMNRLKFTSTTIIQKQQFIINQQNNWRLSIEDPHQKQQSVFQNNSGLIPLHGIEPQILKNGEIKIQEQQMDNQNGDIGFGGQDDAQQDDGNDVEDESKKKGKLDPLVKVFILQRIRQKAKSQYKAQKKLQVKHNKQQIELKQDEQALQHIKQWAAFKSRLKTQTSRKIQSNSKIKKILTFNTQKKKNQTFQHTFDSLRVNSTISAARKIIPQMKEQTLNTQKGLSLYDRRRAYTQQGPKFSQILQTNARQATKDSALDQIQDIKTKFSRLKIYAPINKLVGALIHPNQKETNINNSLLDLPTPQLPSNPFFKVVKKKKKKKKK